MINFQFPDHASAAAQQVRCELQRVQSMCAPLVLPPPDGHKRGDAPNADVQRAYELANKGLAQLRAGDVAGATRTALTANRVFMNGFTHLLEPVADADTTRREKQSARATRPRNTVVDSIIKRLARGAEKPSELWDRFYGELDAALLNPKFHASKNLDERRITYNGTTDKRRGMAFKTFRQKIKAPSSRG